MIDARAKKTSIEAEKVTGDNIYKVLIYFDKLYFAMNDVERRQLIEALIAEIQIYEERKPNGQWLKSIRFKLPIIENDLSIGLDNGEHVESIALLSKLKSTKMKHINVELEMDELDLTAAESKATYEEIKEYVLKQSGLKVSNLYIAQVKQKCGIIERANYNLPKSENSRQPKCPLEKELLIEDALRHFKMI